MTTASMFGVADFDRDVRRHISKVKKLERHSGLLSWAVNQSVSLLARVTFSAVNGVADWTVDKLDATTDKMERSTAWFNDEYQTYCTLLVQRAEPLSVTFVEKIQNSRKTTRHLAAVCLKNARSLRTMTAVRLPKLIHAFENLASMCHRMDLALKRYEETAIAARTAEVALLRNAELRREMLKSLENFNDDDPSMNDPEFEAAAKEAVARMQRGSTMLTN